MTFADDILEAAGGEPIMGIVICAVRGPVPYGEEKVLRPVLTWDEVKDALDYNYNACSGREDCHAIFAWTKNKVIFISNYDGATEVCSMPRNPQKSSPIFFGGG